MTESLPQDFIDYKTSHPEFFPPSTPIEKQLLFFNTIRERERIKENIREMEKVSADVSKTLTECERLREHAAISELSKDNPMQIFTDAFSISHIGHYQILRAVVYAECLKSSCTTKGLQPAVTGSRGSGKSHAVKTAINLIPKNSVYTATLSPKALFYKKPERKTTFYMDDAVIPEELVSLMKRKQTQFQEPTIYGTVVDKKWAEISIDKRMVFITTSVAQLGDEQLTDRALLIDIKNERADDEMFYKFESERRMKGLPEFPETPEVLLCRDMLAHIRSKEFQVIIPQVDFAFYHDRRLIGQCYDLMEGSAIFHYRNRKHEDSHGVVVVEATGKDLENALDFDMFKFADNEVLARLSKSERAFDMKVQELLDGSDTKTFTEKQLSDDLNLSVPTVRNYLYGREISAIGIKDGTGLCGKTKWYKVDIAKDHCTEAIKNHIIVHKHNYYTTNFAWIKQN